MKIRTRTNTTKIETQMAPMIDVVFLLLVFFMLTLKIVEPEGDFDINMPIGAPAQSTDTDPELPPFKVRMQANPKTGELVQLSFNGIALGSGRGVFDVLNAEILKSVNALQAAGPGNLDRQEVEIDPDYGLQYENIISAISACSGKMVDGRMVRYISRIKFAPRREKPDAARDFVR